MNLKQAYRQTEVISSQERQKDELKELIKLEETLKQDFYNLSKINSANTVNCPAYVQAMVKTMEDQTEDCNKFR